MASSKAVLSQEIGWYTIDAQEEQLYSPAVAISGAGWKAARRKAQASRKAATLAKYGEAG